MARRVFLHIGVPKSGTTYLQDRFVRNRDVLAAQGIHYPEMRSGDHFEAALDLIQRPWAGELRRARGQWQVLADAVRKVDDDVLVSHEILAAARPEQVARANESLASATDDVEMHVVLTVRDLARQIPAEWQESVKHRSPVRFETFAKRVATAPRTTPEMWFWRVQSLPDVLTRWATGLTPDQVHVVTVPHPGAPPETLWERFGSVLGLDTAVEYAPSELANASLGTAEVAVIRRLNHRLRRAGVSRSTYVPIVRELIARETFGRHEGMDTATVPAGMHPFVEDVTQEWIEWLHGSGVEVVGDLDDLLPVLPEEGTKVRHPDRPRPSLVAQAAIEALAEVLVELDATAPTEEMSRGARRLGRRLLGS